MTWRALLYSNDTDILIGSISVPHGPICGQDFCDSCGDCLSCYYCAHQLWVVYQDDLAGFLAEHTDARVEAEEE